MDESKEQEEMMREVSREREREARQAEVEALMIASGELEYD